MSSEYLALLGMEAKDKVTGFKGVVASVVFDLYGCVQVVLTPPANEDGKLPDSRFFDAKRLKITGKKPVMPVPRYAALAPGDEIGAAERPAGLA